MAEEPAILYHYTSFDAFQKIIESEVVRATHYSELNDIGEIQMGRRIVETSLETCGKGISTETMAYLRS